MKGEMKTSWSDEQRAAGERFRQTWDEFFRAAQQPEGTSQRPDMGTPEEIRIADVRARHEAELLQYPNVVAVSEGIRTKLGRPTGERCLVVYVERKIPRAQLEPSQILPTEIEGIPVDVVEIGRVEPLTR